MEAAYNIINYRREICQRCDTPCQFQNDVEFRTEGENVCPQGKWMAYQTFIKNVKATRGAGDAVALVAEPIARLSDRVLKTKIGGCSACRKRKEMLNHLIPWGQRPPP